MKNRGIYQRVVPRITVQAYRDHPENAMQHGTSQPLVFEEVYTRYFDGVVKYLAGIVGADDAADIAQESFIKVHEHLGTLNDPGKLSSWIYKIALNTARDRLRKDTIKTTDTGVKTRREEPRESDDMERFADRRGRTPEEKIIRREMIECYVDFVEKLPEPYCTVYILSQFDGLSNGEIAERLSITLDTVKIRLHRARTMLHESLRTHCQAYHDAHGELQAAPRDE